MSDGGRERRKRPRAAGEDFRRLFGAAPTPMWVYEARTLRFLEVNDAAVRRYGWDRAQFLTMALTDLHPPDHLAPLLEAIAAGEHPGIRGPTLVHHALPDGRGIEVEVTAHLQEFAGRPAVVAMSRDITDQRALEEELNHQALHDALTGLANRALFRDRVEHALARISRGGGRCAAVALDLDGFKAINESLGHSAGDVLLVETARRLTSVLRAQDTAARLGGDEFALLVEDVASAADVEQIADRVLAVIRSPVHVAGREMVVTATAGIAVADPGVEAVTHEDLLRDVDVALDRAKLLGGNVSLSYAAGMQALIADRLSLANDLRGASARDELYLVFQPLVSLRTGAVSGVEALVRWAHPDRGLIVPDIFVPLAEEAGLIGEVDRWVLTEACACARTWRDAGMTLRVSVNVSGRDLDEPRLAAEITAVLEHAGLEPRLLELELTEGTAVRQGERALSTLYELRERGVTVAIDDFGTGYSILSRLREFPVDRIKIDRAFVQEVTPARTEAPLVAAMIGMARALGLAVVAEGVETAEQLAYLIDQGCDEAQGYLLGRPVTADLLAASVAAASGAVQTAAGRAG